METSGKFWRHLFSAQISWPDANNPVKTLKHLGRNQCIFYRKRQVVIITGFARHTRPLTLIISFYFSQPSKKSKEQLVLVLYKKKKKNKQKPKCEIVLTQGRYQERHGGRNPHQCREQRPWVLVYDMSQWFLEIMKLLLFFLVIVYLTLLWQCFWQVKSDDKCPQIMNNLFNWRGT